MPESRQQRDVTDPWQVVCRAACLLIPTLLVAACASRERPGKPAQLTCHITVVM